jgi:hypothetical protein
MLHLLLPTSMTLLCRLPNTCPVAVATVYVATAVDADAATTAADRLVKVSNSPTQTLS